MKKMLVVVILTSFASVARSQSVPRITKTDVDEARAHPECSGGKLSVDNNLMPEANSEDIRVASYIRQFRAYRDNTQHSPNMMIHINDDSIKADGRIRDVTPSYFHIETKESNGNKSYCFIYGQITQVNYDSNRNLHISVRQ